MKRRIITMALIGIMVFSSAVFIQVHNTAPAFACQIDDFTGKCYSPCKLSPSHTNCDGKDPFTTGCNEGATIQTTAYESHGEGYTQLLWSNICQSNYSISYALKSGDYQYYVVGAGIAAGSSTCPSSCSIHTHYDYTMYSNTYTSFRTDMVYAPVDKAEAYALFFNMGLSGSPGSASTKWCWPCA